MFGILQLIIEKPINEENTPDNCNLNTLFQKGDRRKCENHREIRIKLTMEKLYGRVLRNKLDNNKLI